MNLLTSSLSTSFSVPSSPSWAHGGMETDATISDETDKRIGLNSFVYYYSFSYMSIIPVSIRNHHGKSSVGSFHHLCRCSRL